MKQALFVDLNNIKKINQRISVYILFALIALLLILFTIGESKKGFAIFVFLVAICGVIGLWLSYFTKYKLYKNQPYIVLDDVGITIFNQNKTEIAKWQDIQAFDLYSQTRDVHYFIQAITYIRLDNGLMNAEMITTLKYAIQEHTSLKFIF